MFAIMLVKVEGKTVAKTVQDVEVEALVHTPPDKTQEVVAKTIADELIRVRVVLSPLLAQIVKNTLSVIKAETPTDTLTYESGGDGDR